MTSSTHATAGVSFEVHLQSLRDFADELRQQLSALAANKETVEALAAHRVRAGDFLEAAMLLARHREAVDQVRALLAGIDEALGFAEQVTDTVGDAYQRQDSDVASSMGAVGAAASGAGRGTRP
ncbi:MAG: hypothetical protein ACRCZD_08110 [Phycicoccus sp.]